MKQILVIIFLIIPIAYGMDTGNATVKTSNRQRSNSLPPKRTFSDPELKRLAEKSNDFPSLTISRQPSTLPDLKIDTVSLHQQIHQLKKEKKELEEMKQILTINNETLIQDKGSLNLQIVQLKQPNKFVRFYVATTLGYMIGTLAYFTYPWWSIYIRSALPHMLYYKR